MWWDLEDGKYYNWNPNVGGIHIEQYYRNGLRKEDIEYLRMQTQAAKQRVVNLFTSKGINIKLKIQMSWGEGYGTRPLEYDIEKDYYAKGVLRKSELVHNEFYYGACNCSHLARWDAEKQEFNYIISFGGHWYEPLHIEIVEHFIDGDDTPFPATKIYGSKYKKVGDIIDGTFYHWTLKHFADDDKTNDTFIPLEHATKEQVRKEYHL